LASAQAEKAAKVPDVRGALDPNRASRLKDGGRAHSKFIEDRERVVGNFLHRVLSNPFALPSFDPKDASAGLISSRLEHVVRMGRYEEAMAALLDAFVESYLHETTLKPWMEAVLGLLDENPRLFWLHEDRKKERDQRRNAVPEVLNSPRLVPDLNLKDNMRAEVPGDIMPLLSCVPWYQPNALVAEELATEKALEVLEDPPDLKRLALLLRDELVKSSPGEYGQISRLQMVQAPPEAVRVHEGHREWVAVDVDPTLVI